MFSFRKKSASDNPEKGEKKTPFYADAMEICFHPVYTQTPMIYLMTRSRETRIRFLFFMLGSMDVYFERFADPESVQIRRENVSLISSYMDDREAVLSDSDMARELAEHVNALFRKVMQAADDLSLDDKLNMVLYNAKAFLGLEPRSRRNGRLEKLKEAWEICEKDAGLFLEEQSDGKTDQAAGQPEDGRRT